MLVATYWVQSYSNSLKHPNLLPIFLWTHAVLMLKGVDISVYLQVILEANLGLYSLDAIEIIFVA